MAKARFDIPAQLTSGVSRPIYAGVGATDRVVAAFREAAADMRKRAIAVRQDLTEIDYEPQALRRQAAQVVTAGVAGLQTEARELPARLQSLVETPTGAAGDAFEDLVKRGETLVGRIRRQSSTTDTVSSAETTVAKAKTTRTQAAKTAKKSTATAKRTARKSPARSSAKATATSAKKTASSAARATVDAASKVGS
jgi:Mg-chelatase subunit ChlI